MFVCLNHAKIGKIIELCKFYDDYFSVTIATPEETHTIYHKYNDINVIKISHEKSKTIVDDYNALNYKFKSNK